MLDLQRWLSHTGFGFQLTFRRELVSALEMIPINDDILPCAGAGQGPMGVVVVCRVDSQPIKMPCLVIRTSRHIFTFITIIISIIIIIILILISSSIK
jgi:hypothetical protein